MEDTGVVVFFVWWLQVWGAAFAVKEPPLRWCPFYWHYVLMICWIVVSFLFFFLFFFPQKVKRADNPDGDWMRLGELPGLSSGGGGGGGGKSVNTVGGGGDVGDDDAPVPQNEYEAYLNEYYRNHYEQLYLQLSAEYENQLKVYEEERAKQEKNQQHPPDDGYQIPQVEFKEYGVTGQFDRVKGRMVAVGEAGDQHFINKGLKTDAAGRQLNMYYDVDAFQEASAAGLVVKNDADKSKAKKAKSSAVPKWMEDDPLEGAYRPDKLGGEEGEGE